MPKRHFRRNSLRSSAVRKPQSPNSLNIVTIILGNQQSAIFGTRGDTTGDTKFESIYAPRNINNNGVLALSRIVLSYLP